jgi:hypothetical protein
VVSSPGRCRHCTPSKAVEGVRCSVVVEAVVWKAESSGFESR